ncbi:cell wall surface anchor family protein [Enterococcus casseliflavus]|uniref:DUF916 and DUF3324 domain-containing protein n=1 Tax=Enterococcus casseliflavus TaxID=37734 RepID=UPI0008F2EC6E|nr:DUF916 and DUF3324 domain-containing protein [Enterococcus casseliflavus]SFD45471.1 protein of unknown function [Enterococcus casseliflavus]STP33514.1 cell wall surface anchor family protein [Enterococcus casseliflavus]
MKFLEAVLKQMKCYSVLFFTLILGFPVHVMAEESALNFYVTPEFPESQIDDTRKYFHIQAEPDSVQNLRLKLQNGGDKDVIIRVTAHTAYTNVLGSVEYGQDAEHPDPTLKHTLDELIDTPEPITLSAKETTTLDLALSMPKEYFEGVLAGGLRIEEVKPEDEENTFQEEGLSIENEYAYVVAVLVNNDRSSIKPDMELLDVFADQLNYRNVISANLQNFTPVFINKLAVEASVQKEGEDELLYEARQDNMQMAPNSNFNFPISLEGDRFQSGDYILKLKATSKNDIWEWEKKFTIKADEAETLNRRDVTIDTSTNWWIMATISLIVLLFGIFIYSLVRRRQHEKGE